MELARLHLKLFGRLPYIMAFLVAMQIGVAQAALSNEAVENAVAKRVCFEAFWWGRSTFELGKTVPIVIRHVGDKAYVWTESLSAVPNVKVWANFFSVFSSGGMVMVGESHGYNVDEMRRTPPFAKDRALVFEGTLSTVMFHVPTRCAPIFETETPFKQLMIKIVETSVAQELTLFKENGEPNLPSRLKIVIANFNPTDPATAVLVPSSGQIFYVALHDASNPFSDRFLRKGVFPVQPENNKHTIRVIIPKIERYGIIRTIRLPLN